MSENKLSLPTEIIELPSEGLVYPPENPLSSGKVEMRIMTAKDEDILTNQAYIENMTVLDKLLQSLIVSKINIKDLISGDKNALLVAARVLGYGNNYSFTYKGKEVTVDLSKLNNKPLNKDLFTGKNEFNFTCPNTGAELTFKLLTHQDEIDIEAELKGYRKINKDSIPELSTKLKFMILSVNGNYDKKIIREFVDNYFIAQDSRALRAYIREIQPNVDLTIDVETASGTQESIDIPITLKFFWPDSTI